MALVDTLESLVAKINQGIMSVAQASLVVKVRSVREFLRFCKYYSLEIESIDTEKRINEIENEFDYLSKCL